MAVAAYVRVSTIDQNHDLQVDQIGKWTTANDKQVVWFKDHFTGRTFNRPGWTELWSRVEAGEFKTIVIWKLDRLGRSTLEMANIFQQMIDRGIQLISLTDGIDLATPNGRLLANLLASVAQYESEIKRERIVASIRTAQQRNGGKAPWAVRGAKARIGTRKADPSKAAELRDRGFKLTEIAKQLEISTKTVKRYLVEHAEQKQ